MNHFAKLSTTALVSFILGAMAFKFYPNDEAENLVQVKEQAMWSSHTNLSLMLSLFGGPTGNEEGLTEEDFELDKNVLNQFLLTNALNYESYSVSSNNKALRKSLKRTINKIKNYVSNNPSQDCLSMDSVAVLNCELTKVIGRHKKMISLLGKFPNITRN